MIDNIETLEYKDFKIKILLTNGGNPISFTSNKVEILNSPKCLEEYQKAQNNFGIPNLFPPNRIKDGKFTFENKEYQFPKKRNGHSLHGFLNDVTWKILKKEVSEDFVSLILCYTSSKEEDYYSYYPHLFTIERTYTLDKNGLTEYYKLKNLSEERMPVSIGFHTAFKIHSKDLKILGSLGKKIELDSEKIPTGNIVESDLKDTTKGFDPLSIDIDAQYRSLEGENENTVIIKGNLKDKEIHYIADKKYKYWVLCNYSRRGDIFCIEPHTSMIDGHNRKNGDLISLEGNQTWESINRIEIRDKK